MSASSTSRRPRSPSPTSRTATSSNTASPSPLTTSRAHGWFNHLEEAWNGREKKDYTETNRVLVTACESILRSRSSVHDGILHVHSGKLIGIVDEAVEIWKRSRSDRTGMNAAPSVLPPPPTAATTALPSTTQNESPAKPSTSAPSSNRPFQLAPYTLHAILRLLVLTCQRLPGFYSAAWTASLAPPAGGKNVAKPLPKGMEVEVYQAWFGKVRGVARNLLHTTLHPPVRGTSRHPWDPRLSVCGLHLLVLALAHAPSTSTDTSGNPQLPHADDARDYGQVEHALADPWFSVQLPQYELASDLLSCLVSIFSVLPPQRLHRVTMLVVKGYGRDPKNHAAVAPHDASFIVTHTPPGLTVHEALRSFVSQAVQAAVDASAVSGEQRVDEQDERTNNSDSTTPTQSFARSLLSELRSQFLTSTTSSSSSSPPLVHRCLLPLFALLGVLDAIDPEGNGGTTRKELGSILVQAQAKQELARMLQFVLNGIPEVIAACENVNFSPERPWPCSSSAPSVPGAPSNRFGACCASCLFVFVASAGVVEGSRWIPNLLVQAHPVLANEKDSNAIANKTEQLRHIIRRSTFLVAKVFLHIIDTSWVLNGSIRTGIGTVAQLPNSGESAASTVATPANPTNPSTSTKPSAKFSPRLAAWLASPFFALLPQYTRALSMLFLALRSSGDEFLVLTAIWQRARYMHQVWRWWSVYGQSGNGVKSNTPGPADASAAHTGDQLQLTPIKLSSITVQRSHDSTFMSVSLFLCTLLRDGRWRNGSVYSASEPVGSNDSHVLSPESKSHAFTMAMIIDILSCINYSANTALTESYKPHKELMTILGAIMVGREVVQAPVPGEKEENTATATQASIPTSHSALRRQLFAKEVILVFLRCFLRPDEVNSPVEMLLGMSASDLQSFDHHNSSLPSLLGLSGKIFAPSLVARDIPPRPKNPSSCAWPAPAKRIHFSLPHPMDPIAEIRTNFISGLLAAALGMIPFDVAWFVLLPWAAKVSGSGSVTSKNASGENRHSFKSIPRAQHLLVLLTQRTYRVATHATEPDVLTSTSSATKESSSTPTPGLHPLPTPEDLELFARKCIPFLISRSLTSYPSSGTNFQGLLDTALILFSTLPSNDVLQLALLQKILDRAWTLLLSLLRNNDRLTRWRQVVELVGKLEVERELESLMGMDGEDEDEAEWDPVILPLPKNVRLPSKFPSLTAIRRLLLLHLQLMQALDAPLYPRALEQVSNLFNLLDPHVYPLATPVRASLATMIHTSLTRGFDLSKRDATAIWYMKLVEEMNIPISIKSQYLQPTTSLTAATLRTIDALKDS